MGDALLDGDVEGWWQRCGASPQLRPLRAGRRLLTGPPGRPRTFTARKRTGQIVRWSEAFSQRRSEPVVDWYRRVSGCGYLCVTAWPDTGETGAGLCLLSPIEATPRSGGIALARSVGFLTDPLTWGFAPGADAAAVHDLAGVGTVASRIREIRVHVVTVPVGTVQAAIAAYEGLPGVAYAEANTAWKTLRAPNDPLLEQQYQVDHINAVAGWNRYNNAVDAKPYAPNGGATLAILDSGIDRTHPELASKIVECASYLTTTGNRVNGMCQDSNFHGTYVAGIASGIANNAQGIAGIGFDADLLVYQVCTLFCFTADSASAMVDAAVRGADAANYSFGGASPNNTSRRAVEFAHSKGMLQVASAGNSGDGAQQRWLPRRLPERDRRRGDRSQQEASLLLLLRPRGRCDGTGRWHPVDHPGRRLLRPLQRHVLLRAGGHRTGCAAAQPWLEPQAGGEGDHRRCQPTSGGRDRLHQQTRARHGRCRGQRPTRAADPARATLTGAEPPAS